MREFIVKTFDKGVINDIESYSIPDGAASDSLNWLTKGDKIELRRGYKIIGTELSGSGKVTGLHVSRKADGTTQPFYTYDRKIKYYDSSTTDWVEIGTDQLPVAASGEDISFASYVSLAGYQTFISSPNSSFYKIMNANPGSISDVYNSSKSFKGYLKVRNGRSLLWNRTTDKVNVYGSWIDAQDSSVYTTVSAENIGTGDGSTVTFTDTLAFKGGGSRRTCFAITATDGTETFTDNRNGILTGSAGGTGTINYTTGAISVTFAVAPTNLQAITADYQWEDVGVKGLSDYSSSATRVAGEGFTLLQGDGGFLRNIEILNDVFYCLHDQNTWFISIPANDLVPTNRIYRDNVGISNWRASKATGEGIYYIDVHDPVQPRFKLLSYAQYNTEVVPISVTLNVDLNGYNFDSAVSFEWGDYLLFSFKTADAAKNNRTMVYHKVWKSIDILDYAVSCYADKDGLLWAGDSLTNNVMELFSGFDDNNTTINNYWSGNISMLGTEEIKKVKRLTIEGEISTTQGIDVYVSYDRGSYVFVGSIEGGGDYVDTASPITIGSTMVGESEIGGGGSGTIAYHYMREFRIQTDTFKTIQIKFVATGVGYASVSTENWYDIRFYGKKNIQRYRQTI